MVYTFLNVKSCGIGRLAILIKQVTSIWMDWCSIEWKCNNQGKIIGTRIERISAEKYGLFPFL